MEISKEELEKRLLEAGNRLLTPPSSVDELLSLLDRIESCLSRVKQSPSPSMHIALSPSLKALVANELLRHSDKDVKVFVASCISDITRITAPDAPYSDEQMKEFFQLTVEAFEKLYDTTSVSYSKRVSILVTLAKVRLCVVMLDLECDALILEMFQHFLKAIRDNHSDLVFSSMETIMTLILEESEEISSELLSLLLASVKNNNQDVIPIARRLGEKVLNNCAVILKPYLLQLVQSTGISFNDYSEIVASICGETFDTVEHCNVNPPGEHLVAEGSKLSEKAGEELPQVAKEHAPDPEATEPTVDKSPRSVMSNGSAQTGNDDSLVDPNSLKKKKERSHRANHSKSRDAVTKAEPDSLDFVKDVKYKIKPYQGPKKKRGWKPNSAMNSTETSDHAQIDSEKEVVEEPDHEKSNLKEADNSLSESPSNMEAAVLSEQEKEPQTEVSSLVAPLGETVNVSSPSLSQSLHDGARPKRGRGRPKNKEDTNQVTETYSPQVSKETLSSDQLDSEVPESSITISKKESKGTSDSEVKPHRHSRKMALPLNATEEKSSISAYGSKNESEVASDSEAKPLKQLGKKASKTIEKNKEGINQVTETCSPQVSKGTLLSDQLESEVPESSIAISKKESKGTSDSEVKPHRHSRKKALPLNATEEKSPTSADSSKKESEVASDLEAKPPKQLGKKSSKIDEKKLTARQEGGKKQGGSETVSEADALAKSNDKKTVSSPNSTLKSSNKDQNHLEERPQAKYKRKRTKGQATSGTTSSMDAFGENLVSSKIKVWWPEDEMFYEGIIDSFDPVGRKHKVLYDDGEEEILFLREERWELVKGEAEADKEQPTDLPTDLPIPDASEKPGKKKKKPKTNSDSSTKKVKTDASLKMTGGSSKSKGETTKSGDDDKLGNRSKGETVKTSKLKDDSSSKSQDDTPKTGSKLKDATPKPSGKSKSKDDTPKKGTKSKNDTPKKATKSKDDTPKMGTMSKNETPKMGNKSKDETPKASNKSKGENPKLGSKSSANDTSTKGKSSSFSKVQESDESVKIDLPELANAQESETKVGKKRKRKLNSTKGKSNSSKVQVSDESEKIKLPELANTQESGTKVGKKQQRKGTSAKGKSSSTKVQKSDESAKEELSEPVIALDSETKIGKKRKTEGNSAKGKSSSSKVQESDDSAKGKLSESVNAHESKMKVGKKPQRKGTPAKGKPSSTKVQKSDDSAERKVPELTNPLESETQVENKRRRKAKS